MIETARLILRPWRKADREPWAAINTNPEVSYWLGGLDRAKSDAAVDRYVEQFQTAGFCRWALERRQDGALIGSTGIMPARNFVGEGAFEIGWRLARAAWGFGYATEAARAALADSFSRAGLEEIIAYTAKINARSQAVMERINMVRDPARDFEHTVLAKGDPLRPHVVYVARRPTAQ